VFDALGGNGGTRGTPMASEPDFDVVAVSHDDRIVLQLSGELDVVTSDRLAEELETALNEARPLLVVDLNALTFLDSRGIATLVHAFLEAPERGTTMSVTGARSGVRRVFEITGLEHMLTDAER
jgi:anti-anti-sigma factor